MSYNSLCQELTQQFLKQTSVFRQRCQFYNLKQTPMETVNDWFASQEDCYWLPVWSLVHFDSTLRIQLVCDASNIGMGAVLLHIYEDDPEKSIYFVFRPSIKAEQKYFVIHKEAAAIY
ncbi:hypothetical protein ILUMI_07352 [Ignelater luminosus]|uniref:Reverse transcriptase/retrotransposon-derived protein RNase H-like domain-containing protein n=1 Tax=Ignelater luminosus TaxID=2038154 RepID=A0A8K0D3P8_IGNLU|nr:hypothetical protein ILUMI_07352 [Ignelater luminosus]